MALKVKGISYSSVKIIHEKAEERITFSGLVAGCGKVESRRPLNNWRYQLRGGLLASIISKKWGYFCVLISGQRSYRQFPHPRTINLSSDKYLSQVALILSSLVFLEGSKVTLACHSLVGSKTRVLKSTNTWSIFRRAGVLLGQGKSWRKYSPPLPIDHGQSWTHSVNIYQVSSVCQTLSAWDSKMNKT